MPGSWNTPLCAELTNENFWHHDWLTPDFASVHHFATEKLTTTEDYLCTTKKFSVD